MTWLLSSMGFGEWFGIEDVLYDGHQPHCGGQIQEVLSIGYDDGEIFGMRPELLVAHNDCVYPGEAGWVSEGRITRIPTGGSRPMDLGR